MQKVGPRPGAAALAAFPQGPGSIELGLCAAAVLSAGFLLGRSGRRQRWAKFVAGSADALLALLVFSGILAILPDSRWPELLLSLTAALLLMSLTALRRFARPRGRDGELSLSESTPAEEEIIWRRPKERWPGAISTLRTLLRLCLLLCRRGRATGAP